MKFNNFKVRPQVWENLENEGIFLLDELRVKNWDKNFIEFFIEF